VGASDGGSAKSDMKMVDKQKGGRRSGDLRVTFTNADVGLCFLRKEVYRAFFWETVYVCVCVSTYFAFIEDTFGQRMRQEIKDKGQAIHSEKYGTFLVYTDSPSTYHLNGKCYVPFAKKLELNWDIPEFERERAIAAAVYAGNFYSMIP